MKLLVSGSDKVYAIENLYVKYLRKAGHEIFHFPAQSMFYDYYQKNILNKFMFKTGLSSIHKKIDKKFRLAVDEFKPEVIWVFKGMELFYESLEWAKDRKIKLVNYNPDNPFIFSGSGSGNNNLKRAISLYDLHLTYNTEVKKEMEKEYGIRTEILPFGYDVSDEVMQKAEDAEEIEKLCFLGNPDKFRGDFLQQLAEQGVKLDVFGNNWSRFVSHKNIGIFNPVYGDELWITLRRYRIQLNLMRPHNLSTHNMRSFEIPGIGGIQLAPFTPDHEYYFVPNQEIFIYSDFSDCITQINKILALPKSKANQIRVKAKNRSENSNYSYKSRSLQALAFIKEQNTGA